MDEITTLAELDALPVGSVIRDAAPPTRTIHPQPRLDTRHGADSSQEEA